MCSEVSDPRAAHAASIAYPHGEAARMLVKIKTEIRDDLRSTERGEVAASAGRGHGSSTAYAGQSSANEGAGTPI